MRKINISEVVWMRLDELADYLANELKQSELAVQNRRKRMIDFLGSFGAEVDYPLCRFKRWRTLGYRCAAFESDWIFAYEVFDEGVIVRDMTHAKLLKG